MNLPKQVFKTIMGTTMADIVMTREIAIRECQRTNFPQAFPDKQLHCYRIIAPGSIDDFTAVIMSNDLHTSDTARYL